MTDFTIHTRDSASSEGKSALERTQQVFGGIPNLMGGLAEAPAAADAYLELTKLVGRTSFTPTERHVVWFTFNTYNNCEYCMAAHTTMAKGEKIDDAVIETARNEGTYDDPKLEALRSFAYAVADQRGWVSDDAVQAFLDAGFTKQNVLEVVLIAAHKTLSNYANHIIGTPVDDMFASATWEKSTAGVG